MDNLPSFDFCWSDYLNGDFDDGYGPSFSPKLPAQSSGTAPTPSADGKAHTVEREDMTEQSSGWPSIEEPPYPVPSKKRPVFSSDARLKVRVWLDAQAYDPYPTAEEKDDLARELTLSVKQISTLFNNERRRYTNTNQKSNGNSSSPSPLIKIPSSTRGQSPIERYLSSSPEEDPQPVTLVASVAATFQGHSPLEQRKNGNLLPSKRRRDSDSGDASRIDESSLSGQSSTTGSSTHSNYSASSCASGRQGKRRTTTARPSTSKIGRYYCTYCWKNFAGGSSWRKHEETIHSPQKSYECRMSEFTPTMRDCGACPCLVQGCLKSLDHKYKACWNRSQEARVFNRRDHFQNHLRQIHNADLTPNMETWIRSTSNNIRSRCGFCGKWFPTWKERTDHIADHYRFHPFDKLDQSKWRLVDGDQDDDTPTVTQPEPNKERDQSSLVVYQQHSRALNDTKSIFDTILSVEQSRIFHKNLHDILLGGLGGANDFQGWNDNDPLNLVRLHPGFSGPPWRNNGEPNQHPLGPHHHFSCPASTGGTCKFDRLSGRLW